MLTHLWKKLPIYILMREPCGYPTGVGLMEAILDNIYDYILLPILSKGEPTYHYNEHGRSYDFEDFAPKFQGFPKLEHGRLVKDRCFGREGVYSYPGLVNGLFQVRIERIRQFFDLATQLRNDKPTSIDLFLRDNPSHAKFGKMMIQYTLLKKEQKTVSPAWNKEKECEDNWYRLLFENLTPHHEDNPEKILENPVNVITFNYDPKNGG